MKKVGCLFLIMVISAFLLFVDVFHPGIIHQWMDNDQLEEVKDTEHHVPETSNNEQATESSEEVSHYHQLIGKHIDVIVSMFGDPDRIDRSAYDYDWWIYKEDGLYRQIGILDERVVTVYSPSVNENTSPFTIGSSYEEVKSVVDIKEVISVEGQGNSYLFELTWEDLRMRPLVFHKGSWVQLYFDTFTNQLSSVRYLDAETLIKKRPYSLSYRGQLYEPAPLSSQDWEEIERGSAQQIIDITNVIREKHGYEALEWKGRVAEVAYRHSKDMAMNNFFSHTSPTAGELKDRLQREHVDFQVAGENIAAKYTDAIAAVEGWMNSEGHRVNMLSAEFTHLGVGVYEKYYTQNFLTPW